MRVEDTWSKKLRTFIKATLAKVLQAKKKRLRNEAQSQKREAQSQKRKAKQLEVQAKSRLNVQKKAKSGPKSATRKLDIDPVELQLAQTVYHDDSHDVQLCPSCFESGCEDTCDEGKTIVV